MCSASARGQALVGWVFSPSATSPAVDAADPSFAPTLAVDQAGNSRRVDQNGSNTHVPDLGAIERTDVSLAVAGLARIGTQMQFSLVSTFAGAPAPGVGLLLLGFQNGEVFFPGFGFLTAGTSPLVNLGFRLVDGPAKNLNLPADPSLLGTPIAVQSFVLLSANSIWQTTNVWKDAIFQ